ncbi:hypothetical protein [Candidatus Electronema sp. JM]|uniref:hypothetical protein n=1 Tax=Candidatus Electronema sp. JM TaxID=3401571 RepID=UPI003AA7D362
MTEKKNNRDDFSPKTITALRRRAGNRCSNPDCRVPTDAPSDEGPEKVNSIGEAAHITAAAEGGPRYNKALKPDERRAITNGIWLCANCADKIDKDEKTYTVALLHEWKRKAEESAKREQGRKLLTEQESQQEAVNTLVAAATGQTAVFLPNLVPNAIKAESSYWEKIDPRFTVETSYDKGKTGYAVYPNEIVNFKISAKDSHEKYFTEQFDKLIKHGEDIILSSKSVKLKGLPIVEKMIEVLNLDGFFRFENLEKKAINLNIKTISPDLKTESFFCDLHGYAIYGTESITIKSKGLNDMLSMSIRIYPDNTAKAELDVNYNIWEQKELRSLEYFDRIYDFYRKLNNNWTLNITEEREKTVILSFLHDDNLSLFSQFVYFDFIRMTRDISRKIICQIYYNSYFKLTHDLYLKIKEIHGVLSKIGHRFSFDGTLRANLEVNDYSAELLNRCNTEDIYFLFKHEQSEHEQIYLFETNITIPKLSRTFTKVKLKICNKYENIKAGDLVEIELIPADNCECILEKIPDIRKDGKVGIVEQ